MTAQPAATNASRRQQREKQFIIDTDVHHGMPGNDALYPYLSQTYRERLRDYGIGGGGISYANNGGLKGYRADALKTGETPPGGGGVCAVDVEFLQQQLLDEGGIDIAILTGGQMYGASGVLDLDYGSALARAYNDYTIEHWLEKDDRFRYALNISSQDPAGAVAEIERLGSHPQICAVMLPCGAPRPYGHRSYHAIWEACERHGLAIALHFGTEGSGINPPPTSAGYPTHYIESRLARPNFYAVHVNSFIFEGVFRKFPTLKVAMLEGGFGWVPSLMWRMDMDWKGLRHQTPWVEKLPSEYLIDHIRFASQPMEEPEDPKAIQTIIDWMHGDRTLMYASDYPHWDWDDPAVTFTQLPNDLRQRIFAENAADAFGLTIPESALDEPAAD
jgi:predicted TIM-barrel fold metal-dependent hydrolase